MYRMYRAFLKEGGGGVGIGKGLILEEEASLSFPFFSQKRLILGRP